MALPRPLLLALLGAVLVGAAFFASRGLTGSEESNSAGSEVAPAPEAAAPPKKAEAPAAPDIRQALTGSEPVKSGTFELRFSASGASVTADGKFQSGGLEAMPQFEIDVRARRDGKTTRVGAVSDGQRGYLVTAGGATVVAAKTWDSLVGERTQDAKRGPSTDDLNLYSEKELGSFEFRGRETFEGAPVLHYKGQVDPARSKASFGEIADGVAETGLETPLPATLARSVEGGTIDVWVGAEDHLVRRERKVFRYSGGEATYELSRSAVNQPQKIAAPTNAKRGPRAAGDRESLGLAFTALVTAVFAVEAPETVGSRSEPASEPRTESPAQPQPRRDRSRKPAKPSKPAGPSPAAVRRAVSQRRIVILFFRQRGADDDAVAGAVNAVRGRSGVSVFVLPVGKAPKYADVGAADVVRAPTIVFLRRGDDPRLFEGFIDPTTLAQAVTDAR